MAYQQKHNQSYTYQNGDVEMTLDELNKKYIPVPSRGLEDEFLDWIQTEDDKEIQRVLLDGCKLEHAMQNDIDWMRHARSNKERITDIRTVKSGSPLGLTEDEKLLRIKFTWGSISYDIKWTTQIEAAMKTRARDRKIDELLAKDEESFINRCIDNDCIDDDI